MAKNSPDQFFQQGSQIKFKLASDSKDLPNIQNHLKETPGGCIKRKKSGSNQDHALERELRFLKLLWLPQACYLRCPPSTSTAGLACTCLQRPDLPVLLSKTMMKMKGEIIGWDFWERFYRHSVLPASCCLGSGYDGWSCNSHIE
ncbi:uncharacterized protein LOC144244696 isoform X1 [Crocuta crocuta]